MIGSLRRIAARATLMIGMGLATVGGASGQSRPIPTVTVVIPPPPSPILSPTIASPTPAAKALAIDLARLVNGEAASRVQLRNAYKLALPRALAADPVFRRQEQDYPGIIAAVSDATGAELERAALARLPDAWNRLGMVYARYFTEAELGELLGFYRSPTGQWLMAAIAEGADLTQVIGKQLANPDRMVTANDLDTGIAQPGIAHAGQSLTPARKADLDRFNASPVGRKLAVADPELTMVSTAWGNERIPGLEERMQLTRAQTVSRFIADADAARVTKAKPPTGRTSRDDEGKRP